MIVFLAADDYSNVGNNWARALVESGHEAVCLKTQKSAFAHAQTHTVRAEPNEITARLKAIKATKVVIMHSYHGYIHHVPKGLPYWVMHGGSRYRQNPNHIAAVFAKAEGHIIQTPDLLRLVPEQKELFVPAYVPDPGYAMMKPNMPLFAHFPSNPNNKGTNDITRIFREESAPIHIDTMPLPWKANNDRMRNCQVYVELFKPMQNTKQYGTFGVTAIEAALMGRPVLTQCANYDIAYGIKQWNYDGIYLGNTEEDFRDWINRFQRMKFSLIQRAGELSRTATLRVFSAQNISKAILKATK